MIGIMSSDRLSQFDQSQSIGITNATVFQSAFSSLSNDQRCRVGRLPYRHGNDWMSDCATTVSFCQNVHGMEGFDCAAAGKSDQLYLQKIASGVRYTRRIIARLLKQQHLLRKCGKSGMETISHLPIDD